MKIIVSHDVDHIDTKDHLFKDLILEKMFVRSILQLIRKQISWKTCVYRCTMIFRKRMNRIDELMAYDKENNIPSVFFFGMANVLGMSYSKSKAKTYIEKVISEGFDVGVHGCDYQHDAAIKEEHDSFENISGIKYFGIRNHYVRYDEDTFNKMDRAGYLFDTTLFNKNNPELRKPYKVGNMWEFPLQIMDGYVCKQGKQKEGIEETQNIIKGAERAGLKYCTILFHDYQFDEFFDPQRMNWYKETIVCNLRERFHIEAL